MDISANIGGVKIKTPVLTASGTYGSGEEFKEITDLSYLGGIVVKGVTLKERKGNPPPRIVETASGLLNSVGLQNQGVDYFIKEKVPFFKKNNLPLIVNISAADADEFLALIEVLNSVQEIAALEVNVSCPNLDKGGISFGKDPKAVYSLIKAVKNISLFPVITKLTPNVTDITEVAMAAEDAGTDSISLINTLQGMAIDIKERKPKLGNIVGGLSGPAIKPIALRMVWEVCKKVKVPVIGMGGIFDFSDALEFIIAGAQAVALGTVNFINPKAPMEIVEGIKQYMKEHNFNSLADFRGSLEC